MKFKQQSFGESLGVMMNLYIRNIKNIMAGGAIALFLSAGLYWMVNTLAQNTGISMSYARDFASDIGYSNVLNESIFIMAVVFICTTAFEVFLIWMYDRSYRLETGVNARDFLDILKKRIIPALLCNILVYLGIIGGFILLVIPAIVFSLAWSLASNYIVLEELPVLEAMRKSWNITKGSRWSILGLGFISTMISGIAYFLLSQLLDVGVTALENIWSVPVMIYQWKETFLSIFISTPITASIYLVIYHNLKIEKEGLPTDHLEKEFHKKPESTEA